MSYLYKIYIVVNDDSENVQCQGVLDDIIEKSFSYHLDVDLVGAKICELKNNCGKCCNCGAWVSDQEKPDHIDGFSDGCIIDSKWFCDLCVPSTHPKSFRDKGTVCVNPNGGQGDGSVCSADCEF